VQKYTAQHKVSAYKVVTTSGNYSVEYNYANKHPGITVIKVVKEMYYILRSTRSEDINPAKLLCTRLW
jgi:hypothetical protein